MLNDVIAMFRTGKKNDPALKNPLELLLYPCLWAILLHRVAHFLYKLKIPFIPRLISQINRLITGIEIHPGAQIGTGIFIDHGMGVVIGETAKVGNNCMMFHGVTLGSKGGSGLSKTFRHPQIGHNVLLGAGSKLIGPVTVGDGARIGANAIVTKDVQPGQTVISPAAVDMRLRSPSHSGELSKDVAMLIQSLQDKINEQENQMKSLQRRMDALNGVSKEENTITASGTSTPQF